jgi:hypothetical protein
MPEQPHSRRRLWSPIILTSVIVFLNLMISMENAPRRAAAYGAQSTEVLPYYFGVLAAVVAWCGGLLAVFRRPAAAALGLLSATVLFLVPLIWSRWGGDFFLIWWFVFSAVCAALAWFSWMASRAPQAVATAGGGDVETWRRTLRAVNVLQGALILGIVVLNMALLATWGFAVAMVWTVGCFVATFLLTQGIRTVRMWQLGLSRDRVREIEQELKSARDSGRR